MANTMKSIYYFGPCCDNAVAPVARQVREGYKTIFYVHNFEVRISESCTCMTYVY